MQCASIFEKTLKQNNQMFSLIHLQSLRFGDRLFVGGRHQYHTGDSYQYLQKSLIRSDFFQKSLPRLPIPNLSKTCDRYLNAIRPLLNDREYDENRKIIERFKSGPGPKLQTALTAMNATNKHTSYITGMWFEMYLKNRQPVPINFNPALIFQNDTINGDAFNDQIVRCTNLVISALRFYRSLHEQCLEPEVFFVKRSKDTQFYRKCMRLCPERLAWYASYAFFNAYPLDMSQYANIFCTSRRPGMDRDTIYFSAEPQRHIVVSCNGSIYRFEVLDAAGKIVRPHVIFAGLQTIRKQAMAKTNDFPYGVFTTANRTDWSRIRRATETLSDKNRINLQTIDSALFHVALDRLTIDNNVELLVRNFLDGGGRVANKSRDSYRNRWFDKSVSLIVCADGAAGLNFEHSWGDGVAVLRFFEDILKDSQTQPQYRPDAVAGAAAGVDGGMIRELDFDLDAALESEWRKCCGRYEQQCNDLDLHIVQVDETGRDYCKRKRISPDALMQLAFQLAYYKVHGGFVGTYESCSTAAFKHGRTETIRPCTTFTKDYCEKHANQSQAYLRNLIEQSSDYHGLLTRQAAMGQGFDRHLFALQTMAERHEIAVASDANLYATRAYQLLNSNGLSTSSLSSDAVWCGGFGPVARNGYGVAYTIRKQMLGAVVTNYRSASTNGSDYTRALTESFEHLRKVLG